MSAGNKQRRISVEYRTLGQTGMRLSVLGLGGMLAHYEGRLGHPPPEEKRRIYLRAAESGINLFDMGYGDEAHIPDELRGNREGYHFALKGGAPTPADLEAHIDKHLTNLRRDTLDILRMHHHRIATDEPLLECIARLKEAGKLRALCTIRHHQVDRDNYAAHGPDPCADADLVVYNYVCRWQEPGMALSAAAGKGVLAMKALGGQWLSWEDKVGTDWSTASETRVEELAPSGEAIRAYGDLVPSMVRGPWHELAEPGEPIPRPGRAASWVVANRMVDSLIVGIASVAELEHIVEAVESG